MNNYKIKFINSDFKVTELSLMPNFVLQKKANNTYLLLEKSGMTTFDAIEQMKIFFDIDYKKIHAEGLKDEKAITKQIISIQKILTQREIVTFNNHYHINDNDFLKVEIVGYGISPVKEQSLHGNLFNINIRNLNYKFAVKLNEYIQNNQFFSFINYYDSQRFGMDGGPYNTHLIGKAIIENNYLTAFNEYKLTKNNLNNKQISPLNNNEAKKYFKTLNPKKVNFFIAAYNSYLWNSIASEFIEANNKSFQFNFLNVGKLHIPNSNEFKCQTQICIKGYFLSENNFKILKINKHRMLVVTTALFSESIQKDVYHKGRYFINVSFFLPTGCYATMLINQLVSRI